MRWVLEGEWSGYTSAQRHVVHREVVTNARRAARLREMHGIRYTDGTTLHLFIREAKPREKVREVPSYASLIREAEKAGGAVYNVGSVNAT